MKKFKKRFVQNINSGNMSTPKYVVKSIMNHSTSTHIKRFEIDGELTYGRKKYDLFLSKINHHQLTSIANNMFEIPIEPIHPGSVEDFIKDYHKSDALLSKNAYRAQYVILKCDNSLFDGYEFNDFETPSEEDIVRAEIIMTENVRGDFKGYYNNICKKFQFN